MSKLAISTGIVLLVAVIALPWLQQTGLGRWPGGIMIERENFCLHTPPATSLSASENSG